MDTLGFTVVRRKKEENKMTILIHYSIKVVIFAIGVILLFKSQRNSKNLKMMRSAMLAMIIFSLISGFIAYRFWPEEGLVFELFQVGYALIWSLYWFVSRRVKYLMTRGDLEWNYDQFKYWLETRKQFPVSNNE